jgi:hypothetical protein
MEYRGTDYAVVQDIARGCWIWTVDLDERTKESGRRKTQESAVATVELTIDRWRARKPLAAPR